MMIRLIMSDLDHTLLRQDGSVSEKTLRVIGQCREKGIRFAIATARYWIGAERYIDQLKPDYEITTDGTLIHSQGHCIYSCAFSIADTNRIVRLITEAVPGTEITVADGKTVYWNSRHISESSKLYKAVFCEYDVPLEVCANKIVAELPDEGIARRIAERVQCKLQCYRGEKWYAFMPAGSGKTEAIKALSEASGISLAEMVAFGDDRNDLEMLKMCGKGVAVANAVAEVLEAADEVALSNDEDGVAGWIISHCLAGEEE